MRSCIWVCNEESPLAGPHGLYIRDMMALQRPLTLRLDIRGFESLTDEEVAESLLRVVALEDIRCLTRTSKSWHITVSSSLVKDRLLSTGVCVRYCDVDLAPVGVPPTLVSVKVRKHFHHSSELRFLICLNCYWWSYCRVYM